MANPEPKTEHLEPTQWKEGQSGNPAGKPKGTKNLSTWIKEMLEDETFEAKLNDGTILKGAPVKAIVSTLIIKAVNGDGKAFDLLGKYGYGTRHDVSMEYQYVEPILGGVSMHRAKSSS
jgi:hypothetical protein